MSSIEKLLTKGNRAKLERFGKGEIVQQAGQVAATAVFVKSGILRSYVIDSSGKEHIFMFAPEGWIIGDIEAMEYNEPAELFIECIEDSEIIRFERDCLFEATFTSDQVKENAQLLYRRIGRLQRRVLMLMGSSAADRYDYFIRTYPDLPNRVPQHMIASFLGVAPQTLSTIRSKASKNL